MTKGARRAARIVLAIGAAVIMLAPAARAAGTESETPGTAFTFTVEETAEPTDCRTRPPETADNAPIRVGVAIMAGSALALIACIRQKTVKKQ